jgi:hypothetical protein
LYTMVIIAARVNCQLSANVSYVFQICFRHENFLRYFRKLNDVTARSRIPPQEAIFT